MGAAAAQIAIQRLLDVIAGRMRILVEQGLRGHDHAADAVAALRGLLVNEGLLKLARILLRAEALERGDLLAFGKGERRDAGMDGIAVHDDGAGAALGQPAAEFRATQAKIVAQRVKQHAVGWCIDHMIMTIHVDRDLVASRLLGHSEFLLIYAALRKSRSTLRRVNKTHTHLITIPALRRKPQATRRRIAEHSTVPSL